MNKGLLVYTYKHTYTHTVACTLLQQRQTTSAKRAALRARKAGLRGLALRIAYVPAENLHLGLTLRLWSDSAARGYCT